MGKEDGTYGLEMREFGVLLKIIVRSRLLLTRDLPIATMMVKSRDRNMALSLFEDVKIDLRDRRSGTKIQPLPFPTAKAPRAQSPGLSLEHSSRSILLGERLDRGKCSTRRENNIYIHY